MTSGPSQESALTFASRVSAFEWTRGKGSASAAYLALDRFAHHRLGKHLRAVTSVDEV